MVCICVVGWSLRDGDAPMQYRETENGDKGNVIPPPVCSNMMLIISFSFSLTLSEHM